MHNITAITGAGYVATAAPQRDGIHIPVRWIVPSVGSSASNISDDVQTVFSDGESQELVQEVEDVCKAFHPGALLHTFPRDYPVYLFWRAQFTDDWIVAQVTAATSPHNTLNYHCLIFDTTSFHALRYNPFRVRSLNLHDRLRALLSEGSTEPFRCTVPRKSVPTDLPGSLRNSNPIARAIPGISTDCLPNEANLRVIQEYCSRWTDRPVPPPSFATWWSSGNDVSTDYFDVVLRRPAPRPLTLDGARSAVSAVSSALKDLLSNTAKAEDLVTMDLVQLLFLNANSAENAMARAASFSDADARNQMQYRLQNDISEATIHLGQMRTRLSSLVSHLESSLAIGDITEYARLSEQILELEYSLQAVVHPENPVPTASRTRTWPFTRSNRKAQDRNGDPTATPKSPLLAPFQAVQNIFH